LSVSNRLVIQSVRGGNARASLIFIPDFRGICVDNVRAKPKGVFFKGTIIGAIITIPSLVAFFVSWLVLEDEINALIIGMVVHFIGMGFSFKLSKKLFKIKTE